MTHEMVETGLAGFPVRYDSSLVDRLNTAYDRRSCSFEDLRRIQRAVSPEGVSAMGGRTHDGYDWFASMEFSVAGGAVRVLFPWKQDWHDPVSQMDRSINVYSNERIPDWSVSGLLQKIVREMER